MLRNLTVMLGVLLPLAISTPALAEDAAGKKPAVFDDVVAWAKPLSDQEMGELRGGYAGFAFNVIMSGTIAELANTGGTGVTSAPPPGVTVENGMVNLQTSVGSFNGASGVFQIANLENSNFNVINQNLFVQIAIIDVANTAQMPSIQSLFDGSFNN
jgi:hypothetical protein